MRTHTLLRQHSDLWGSVLRLTVSAYRWYSGMVPVLSGRVASCLVGRQPKIRVWLIDRYIRRFVDDGDLVVSANLCRVWLIDRYIRRFVGYRPFLSTASLD